jgi:NTP pyrophosphatase (non-canonical NTP hydrolase)
MSLLKSYQVALLTMTERIRQEQLRTERKWDALDDEDYHVLNTVIGEETGELSRAILELGRTKTNEETLQVLENLRDEAVQVAAMGSMIAEKAVAELERMKQAIEPLPSINEFTPTPHS